MASSRLLFSPAARLALCRGFNQLADTIQVSLGPQGRLVAVSGDDPRRPPDLLNDGATIARRFWQLPNRFETMGALLARHIAWQVEEAVGDGTTTAVIIARHVLNAANRYATNGYNVMSLRRGLEKCMDVVAPKLLSMAIPLIDANQIRILATSITGNAQLGSLIEEIFDTAGSQAFIDVRDSYSIDHDRRYIRGVLWNNGWLSSHFCTESGKAVLKNPFLLFTDRHLTDPAELVPIMECIRRDYGGERGLVVYAPVLEGDALNLLITNKARGTLPTLAIQTPGLGSEKTEILHDLAALCGGRVLLSVTGDRLENASIADLGQADEVQAIRSSFTIIGGKGRPAVVRSRSEWLRKQISGSAYGRDRERLVERSGKLAGGVTILHVGGASDIERNYLKERTREAIQSVRLGLTEGVVPGGGSAFLACLPILAQVSLADDEKPAIRILKGALESVPIALLANAGYEPSPILAHLNAHPADSFDIEQGIYVELSKSKIVDSARVLHTALKMGVSGAIMAFTTDALVHRPQNTRNPDVSFAP